MRYTVRSASDIGPPSSGTEGRLFLLLGLWVAIGFAAAALRTLLVGTAATEGRETLALPLPAWTFGVGWGLSFASMTVAAWLVWGRARWRDDKAAYGLFVLQWLLHAAWAPAMFGLRMEGIALVLMAGAAALLIAIFVAFRRIRGTAAVALGPALAWTLFLLVYSAGAASGST